ncbi:unnamed protein product, partial [Owenia fusiformis]
MEVGKKLFQGLYQRLPCIYQSQTRNKWLRYGEDKGEEMYKHVKFRRNKRRAKFKKDVPYDKRFEMTPKMMAPGKPGARKQWLEKLATRAQGVQATGRKIGKLYQVIPERIPEFVVPDLTDFKLKPYVSWKTPDVVQGEFTPRNLFDACYSKQIIEDFRAGKITLEQLEKEAEEHNSISDTEALNKYLGSVPD